MAIILAHVCKSYGEKHVLRDYCCRIEDGTICVLDAPSGAGKTTLLRLLLGLEKPDSGRITGVPEKKAAVFQEDRLLPGLSALANLRFALPDYDEKAAKELLTELGMTDFTTPVAQLSGGMARRTALARALLADSGLLILDEPFTGLDEANRLAAEKAILRHRRGRTILLVTHRFEELELLQPDMILYPDDCE